MNPFVEGFKESAHLAGEICGFPTGRLIREFGLEDFLENAIGDEDDAPTVAVKALAFFCEEGDETAQVFKFGVLTVGAFLNDQVAKRRRQVPQQALKDLVSILKAGALEAQIRQWIASHF